MLSAETRAIVTALEKITAPDCVRVMTSKGSPNYEGQKWVSFADWEHLKQGVRDVLKLAKAFDKPSTEEQIKNYVEKAQPSVYKGGHNSGPSKVKERPAAPTPTSPPQIVSQEVLELIETAQWARNRMENIADAAWHGDGRDFKRSLVGVFADFDAALAACRPTLPAEIVSRTKPLPSTAWQPPEDRKEGYKCLAKLAVIVKWDGTKWLMVDEGIPPFVDLSVTNPVGFAPLKETKS